MQKKKFSLTQLIFMALMAAVMCIAGPLAVPIGRLRCRPRTRGRLPRLSRAGLSPSRGGQAAVRSPPRQAAMTRTLPAP